MAVIEQGMFFLAIIGLLSTVIAAFYYLRLIKIIYFDKSNENFETDHNFGLKATLTITTGILVLYFFISEIFKRNSFTNCRFIMKLKKYFFNSVTSTNDIAIKKIRQKKISGIIIAKKQTRGRGRYGNKWISMKNNLFMSIFFKLNNNINLHKLTYNCCKIVRKSLMELINCKITIKKPNDLLIKKKRYAEFYKKLYFIKITNM